MPEVYLDLEKGVSGGAATDEKKSSKAAPEVTNIKLRWTMSEIKGRRVIQLDSSKPDVEVQEPYLQRRRVRWQ